MTTYKESGPPKNLGSLNQRLANVHGQQNLVLRVVRTMALVVVGQLLPEGAVKGGSAMALRYGLNARFTSDLDAARLKSQADFREDFEERLRSGWSGFTGRLVERTASTPPGVPSAYIMKPFDVKLDYNGRPWCTVLFELGHNELGDAEEPEFHLADDIVEMFTVLGLPAPAPIPVMATDHQIAQKLHACTAEKSDRARDLVDLQLLDANEELDLSAVRALCVRLFDYRKAHAWPPTVIGNAGWETLYEEQAADMEVAPDVATAIKRVDDLIARIEASEPVEMVTR